MGTHNELGARGEALAAGFLERQGYAILHRNYRYQRAEIDLIAQKGDLLAIVEVKSRTSEAFEPIAGTVGRKKIGMLVLATDHYITQRNLDLEVRFDIVTVYFKKGGCEITHLENAFYYF